MAAYLNGHNHAGNYGEKSGIHYLTIKGMVDTLKNSYGVVEVYEDRLVLKGFGRQEDREMKLTRARQALVPLGLVNVRADFPVE